MLQKQIEAALCTFEEQLFLRQKFDEIENI